MRLVLTLSCLLHAGCHLLFPFDASDPGAADASAEVSTSGDANADGPAADGPPLSGDSASTLDHPKPPDTQPPPDLLVANELPSMPCSGSASVFFKYPSNLMAICKGTSTLTQCTAGSFCATDWHLCTASDYLARGGSTVKAPATAWLASCIRDGLAPFAPSETVCHCKKILTGSPADLSWYCSGVPLPQFSGLYLAVQSWNACRRLGTQTAPAAMWSYNHSATTGSAAVCCY